MRKRDRENSGMRKKYKKKKNYGGRKKYKNKFLHAHFVIRDLTFCISFVYVYFFAIFNTNFSIY